MILENKRKRSSLQENAEKMLKTLKASLYYWIIIYTFSHSLAPSLLSVTRPLSFLYIYIYIYIYIYTHTEI